MLKKIFKLALVAAFITPSFVSAFDALPSTPTFTNLSGVSRCLFDEHRPGATASRRNIDFFYLISLPKSWGATGIECNPLETGKNVIPKARVIFSRTQMPTPPDIEYIFHQQQSNCSLNTVGAEKSVLTAINCHTLISPGQTLKEQYDAAYAEVGSLNCWRDFVTRYVSSSPGCAAVKEKYEKAYERFKEDKLLGSRYACLKTNKTLEQLRADKKASCALIQESCKSYDEKQFKDFCKNIENPGDQCKASGGTVKTDGEHSSAPYCDCSATGKTLTTTSDNIGKCGDATPVPTPSQCGSDARPQDTETGTSVCVCNDASKVYESSSKTCVAPSEAACHARGNNYIFAAPNSCTQCPTGLRMNGNQCGCFEGYRAEAGRCVPSSPTGPATWCNGPSGAAGQHQIKRGEQCFNCPANQNPNEAKTECVPQQQGPQPKAGDECVFQGQKGVIASDGRTCEVRRCLSGCQNGQCVDGRCVPCQQGQVFQNGQCVNDPRQQQQNEEQRCRQNGGEMIQGQCFQKKPNPQQQQQQKDQQKQQQQPQGMTPQQQQQMQQMQAMQECQMRQPQGAWQWNGFQCLPNPNYKPQGYGEQPSITGGVVCNFFGADTIQVPAGEKFTVTYDVTGVKREIKVDTSPKSTTQYTKKDVGDTSTERQATITAPKKKGKLKVSLIVDAVRQNSEACKPIEVQVIDAVPQQDASTYGSDSGGRENEYQEVQQQDTGPRIETVSEIIAQNRKNAPVEAAKAAPEDDDAYAYLCKTLGIGCAKDLPPESQTPSIRDLQVNGGTTNEITIDPDSEDPADLPNIGELPGQEGRQNGQQQLATDIGVDGDGKIVRSAVLDYLGDNGEYAPAVGPNTDTSGVLNSSDDEGPAKTEDRVGIFTRMWRWFLNLLGFGPEYVAA